MVKVEWVDGWPVFNNGKNIAIETEGREQVQQLVTQTKPNQTVYGGRLLSDLEVTILSSDGTIRILFSRSSIPSPSGPAICAFIVDVTAPLHQRYRHFSFESRKIFMTGSPQHWSSTPAAKDTKLASPYGGACTRSPRLV